MELDEEWFRKSEVFAGLDEPKTNISLRVEPQVLSWYKSFGKGYQRRMQAVLRAYAMEHPQASRAKAKKKKSSG